jgi:hypothetical protein
MRSNFLPVYPASPTKQRLGRNGKLLTTYEGGYDGFFEFGAD